MAVSQARPQHGGAVSHQSIQLLGAISHQPSIQISHQPLQLISHQPQIIHAAPQILHAAPIIKQIEIDGPSDYSFAYGVNDPHTHDIKEQKETSHGGITQGSYSLLQSDGRQRIVTYTADKHNGFNAEVKYIGKAVHQEPLLVKKVISQPLISYSSLGSHY